MKKILGTILALCMLALPAAALAQANAYTAYVSDFWVTLPGQEEPVQVDVAFQVGGGYDEAAERGYLQLLAQGGDQLAMQAVAAVENGQYKAYVNGMSSYLKGTVESLKEMIGDATAEISVSLNGENDLAGLSESIEAYAAQLDAAAFAKQLFAVLTEHGFEAQAGQSADLFGEKMQGLTRYEARLTPSQLYDCLNAVLEKDAALKAIVEDSLKQVKRDGKVLTWESIGRRARAQDGKVFIEIAAYVPDDASALRLEVAFTENEDGTGDSIPVALSWRRTETGAQCEFSLQALDADKAEVLSDVSLSFERQEADGNRHASLYFGVYDESDQGVSVIASKTRAHDGSMNLSATLAANVEGLNNAFTFDYTGDETEQDGATLYQGVVSLGAYEGVEADAALIAGVQFAAGLQIAPMPEGELLTIEAPALDPSILDPEGEQVQRLQGEVQASVMQALGVLMGAPGFAQLTGAFSTLQ